MRVGAKVDGPVGKRRRGEHRFAQRVGAEDLRLVPRLQDRGETVFVHQIDLAVRRDGRCGERALDPLLPDDLAGLEVGTVEENR